MNQISFKYDEVARIRTAIYIGTLDDSQLLNAYDGLLRHPDFDPSFNNLADLRMLERVEVSPQGMERLAAFISGRIDALGVATKTAIVAPTDLKYGMGRMYEILRGPDVPEQVRVFRDINEALSWLKSGGKE